MKLKVTQEGLLIPKELLGELEEVEVTQESEKIIITKPQKPTPSIWQLGSHPVESDVNDLGKNHDRYLYS